MDVYTASERLRLEPKDLLDPENLEELTADARGRVKRDDDSGAVGGAGE